MCIRDRLDTEGKTPALVERLNAAIAGANAVLGDDAATDEQVKAAFCLLYTSRCV